MNNRHVALFDIDETLYKGPSLIHFANYLKTTDDISENQLQNILLDIKNYKSGKTDYLSTVKIILEHFTLSIKGKTESEVNHLADKFASISEVNFYDFTKILFSKLSETHDIVFVSSVPVFLSRAFAETLFNDYVKGTYGSILEIINNKYTGNITKQLNKQDVTKNLVKEYGKKHSLAFGDSVDDINMFKFVEYPICVNPKKDLESIAKDNSWVIVNQDNVLPIVLEHLN